MSGLGGFRSLRRGAVALLLAVAVVAIVPSWAPAETSGFTNGTATASAQAFKVNPTASALSLGVTFGISLAGYTNEVAKADARGIDLGIIGTLLAAQGCSGGAPTLPADKQPQPLALDSRDPGAAQGKSEPETVYGNPIPGITKTAKASSAPLADADVVVASLGQPAAFTISGAHSSAHTEIINGNTRQAVATADIGAIDIGGGAIKLSGLHWEITHHTGADTSVTHAFSIGSAVIGGTPLPTQDPAAVIAAANQALNPLGIQIRPPTFHKVNEGDAIDPLSIAVVPSATRDQVSGAILGALQPVREQVTDALLKASCSFGTLITVADVAVGSITGAGSFSLELGGVSASTGEVKLSSLLSGADLSPAPEPVLSTNDVVSTPGVAGTPAIEPGPATVITKKGRGVQGRRLARPIGATEPGHRGGMLAIVGGVGLLLLLAAVEGDRRMMRRAQRAPRTEG